jgi:hypothetical protein
VKEFKSLVPATKGGAVTPSDSAVLDPPARYLYIGSSGDVKVRLLGGDEVIYYNHPIGYLLGQADMVFATGTTASNILALR